MKNARNSNVTDGTNCCRKGRKYRAKRYADPQQRERWLSYQKEKYQKDKLQAKRKLVKDMSRREHRLAKREWKRRQRKSRESQHLQNQKETESVSSSFSSPGTSSEASFSGISRQRLAVIKRRDREKRELEKKVADLECQLQFEKKKAWMYQKRLDRQARQTKDHRDTPRKKAKHVLKYGSKKTVRKTLVFHYAMVDQMKNKYKAGEHKISHPGRRRQFSSAPTLAPEVRPPEECLGRWVMIQYDGKLYPGFVEDVDGGNVYIDCMHTVGKASNTFFWPKIFRDINWYDHEDIMSLITPPTMKPGTSNTLLWILQSGTL